MCIKVCGASALIARTTQKYLDIPNRPQNQGIFRHAAQQLVHRGGPKSLYIPTKKVKKGVDNPLTVLYISYVDSDKDITV